MTVCSFTYLCQKNYALFHCTKFFHFITAAKISTSETSKLGAEPRYMRKLLKLVRNKMDSDNVDITMKFTLSALWNLTGQTMPS